MKSLHLKGFFIKFGGFLVKIFKFLTIFCLISLPFSSCFGIKNNEDKIFHVLQKKNVMQWPLFLKANITKKNPALRNISDKNVKKLNIEELNTPCFAETLLDGLEYGAALIKNKSHSLMQITAILPFLYQGYEEVHYLKNAQNYVNALDPELRLNPNDPVYSIFTELVAAQNIKTEIPIFKIDHHHIFGAAAGAVNDTWICLWKRFDNYSSEEQKHILAHELTHIKYQDTYTRTLATICAPFVSYCAIKGTAQIITSIIDKITSSVDPEEARERPFFLALLAVKNGTNFLSKNPLANSLTQYLLSLYLLSKLCQFQETRADIEGALLAGTVKGGLSWLYNEAIGKYPQPKPLDFFTALKAAPLMVFNTILGYQEHPSIGQRMKDLIIFAQESGLRGAEDYQLNGTTLMKLTSS